MADEKQMTAEEIIIGLRTALQYYANPNQNQGHDLCKDESSHNYNESGECARQALEKFQIVENLQFCNSINIEAGDITIITKNNFRRENTFVYLNGKFQRGVQSIKFEVDVNSPATLTIKRIPVDESIP